MCNSDQATCWLLARERITNLVSREALRTRLQEFLLVAERTQWRKIQMFCHRGNVFEKKKYNTAWLFEVSLAMLGISAGKEFGHYFTVIGFRPLLNSDRPWDAVKVRVFRYRLQYHLLMNAGAGVRLYATSRRAVFDACPASYKIFQIFRHRRERDAHDRG
jgi:hypothetical protein